METRTLLLLAGLLGAGILAAAVFSPSPVPAILPAGTTPGPAGLPVPVTSLPPDTAGSLAITSTPPGAAVWIDTDPAPSGTTPAVFVLSPITHPLRLTLPGYQDYVTSISIPPGSQVSLSLLMEPAGPGAG